MDKALEKMKICIKKLEGVDVVKLCRNISLAVTHVSRLYETDAFQTTADVQHLSLTGKYAP